MITVADRLITIDRLFNAEIPAHVPTSFWSERCRSHKLGNRRLKARRQPE